jgi:hypothetical protein
MKKRGCFVEEKLYDSDGVIITNQKVVSADTNQPVSNIRSAYVNTNDTSILSNTSVLLGTIVVVLILLAFVIFHGYIIGMPSTGIMIGGMIVIAALVYGIYSIKYPTFTLYIETRKELQRFPIITDADKNKVDMIYEIVDGVLKDEVE